MQTSSKACLALAAALLAAGAPSAGAQGEEAPQRGDPGHRRDHRGGGGDGDAVRLHVGRGHHRRHAAGRARHQGAGEREGEQISNVGSQDMSFDIMLKLANRINELAPTSGVDGFVITHGTDTMEETAYFLNLVVKTDKPVVLVGSMRPSTAVSADGPLNLYNGVGVAVDPKARGRGVLLVMNDWIHGAHSLTKTSTTSVQTFMSPLRGLVGVAAYGKNDFYNTPPWKHTTKSEFSVSGVTKLPRVDVIYACADMSPGPHRRRGRQRGQGHRDRRGGQRQHEQGVPGRRRPRGQEGRGGRPQQPRGDGERGPQRGGQRRRAEPDRLRRAEPAEGADPARARAAEDPHAPGAAEPLL